MSARSAALRSGRWTVAAACTVLMACGPSVGSVGPSAASLPDLAGLQRVLVFQQGRGDSIAGRVLGPDGPPLPNVRVVITGQPDGATVLTDSAGRFSLPSPDTSVTLRIESVGFATRRIRVPDPTSGGATLTVTLEPVSYCLLGSHPEASTFELVIEPRAADGGEHITVPMRVVASLPWADRRFEASGRRLVTLRTSLAGYYDVEISASGYEARRFSGIFIGEWRSGCTGGNTRRVVASLRSNLSP